MSKKIAVVGIGNLLLKDEGVGIHVIEELKKKKLSSNVETYDCATRAFLVLESIDQKDKAIIIDAYKGDKEPGTIYKFRFDKNLPYSDIKLSLHDMDFIDVLKLEHGYKLPPEIVIIGVEPESLEFGLELSPKLQKAMPKIIDEVLKEISAATLP